MTRDISLEYIHDRPVYSSATQHPARICPHYEQPSIRVTEVSTRAWSAIEKTCDRYFSVTTLIEARTVGASPLSIYLSLQSYNTKKRSSSFAISEETKKNDGPRGVRRGGRGERPRKRKRMRGFVTDIASRT